MQRTERNLCCSLYTYGPSAAMQTPLEVLRIEMALKLNNSDAVGGIHDIFYEVPIGEGSFK